MNKYDLQIDVEEGVVLSERAIDTIRVFSGVIDNEVCFALLDDQSLILQYTDVARNGRETFIADTKTKMDELLGEMHDFSTVVLENGYGLVVTQKILISVIPPEEAGDHISLNTALTYRAHALDACKKRHVLAIVTPQDPVYHD